MACPPAASMAAVAGPLRSRVTVHVWPCSPSLSSKMATYTPIRPGQGFALAAISSGPDTRHWWPLCPCCDAAETNCARKFDPIAHPRKGCTVPIGFFLCKAKSSYWRRCGLSLEPCEDRVINVSAADWLCNLWPNSANPSAEHTVSARGCTLSLSHVDLLTSIGQPRRYC